MNETDKFYYAEKHSIYTYENLVEARQEFEAENKKDPKSKRDMDHYFFMSALSRVYEVERGLAIGKQFELRDKIEELEAQIEELKLQIPSNPKPKKRKIPVVCLANGVIQFPKERRVSHV